MRGAYLTNQLLVAMPSLADPNFSQTVTLICEHTDKGALGIVINRPLTMALGEVFEQLALKPSDPGLRDRPVLRGGPVQTDRGFVLHPPSPGGEEPWDSTLKVSSTLHVTTSRDILGSMARGAGPAQAVVALGYAGWDAGQLEEEIRSNAWLNVPVDDAIIFDTPFEQRWHAAARLLGIDFGRLSNQAGHA
ncbi:MAG TPA: YqgE/AlgH family protein [Steroidobacteraceae bacterium]|nr:YqgE/AlgH family protein [Steroidobacteraceae bacterium]